MATDIRAGVVRYLRIEAQERRPSTVRRPLALAVRLDQPAELGPLGRHTVATRSPHGRHTVATWFFLYFINFRPQGGKVIFYE